MTTKTVDAQGDKKSVAEKSTGGKHTDAKGTDAELAGITPPVDKPPVDTPPVEKVARRNRLPIAAAVIAALVMITGLFAWWHTSNDADLAMTQTRDVVLISATQNIAIMNSLDYRKVDQGLKAWLSVTTGTLHDQLADVGADDRKLLADQKKISTGKVVDAAVVDLDASSATVIAAVEITVKDVAHPDAKPTLKRNRFTADLIKVRGTWKLQNLQQVAVNLS